MASAIRLLGRAGCAGVLLFLFGCSPAPEPAPTPPVAQTPPQPAPIPVPPPLGRIDILSAVAAASAAVAEGGAYPASAFDLGGRRFSLRLPFGCGARAHPEASLRFLHDPEKGTLRLTARPENWTDADWVRALVDGEDVEAIEGFWLSRPWLLTENCPAPPAVTIVAPPVDPGPTPTAPAIAAPAKPSEETVALVRVFEAGGSRLLRRGGRPYEVTRKLDEAEAPGPEGFRLVLQGRVVAEREPIRCRSEDVNRRPTCLVEVEFDRIAFEDPAGKTLADWRD